MKVDIDYEEDQPRHRNRGQWHLCYWCEEPFEGNPIEGQDRDFCSEECLQAQHIEDEWRSDYEQIERELWERGQI